MKDYRCPNCSGVRQGEDNLIMKVCWCCQVEMEVVE